MPKHENAVMEVMLARAQNWLALRYSKAGYADQARRTREMRKYHMAEARLALR